MIKQNELQRAADRGAPRDSAYPVRCRQNARCEERRGSYRLRLEQRRCATVARWRDWARDCS